MRLHKLLEISCFLGVRNLLGLIVMTFQKKLILKYPCTEDDIGCGFVSAHINISVHLILY